MHQIVSMATPVQPGKENIPSPGAQINTHTLIHLETPPEAVRQRK